MSELRHYGILGMHWGIRRYQNKDGTLTPEGKKHYKEDYLNPDGSLNEEGRKHAKEALSDRDEVDTWGQHLLETELKNREIVEKDDHYIIPKGTEFGRYTIKENEEIKGNKYTYITEADESLFGEAAAEAALGSYNWYEHLYRMKMSSVNDLKIVKAEKVLQDIINETGDKNAQQFLDEANKYDIKNNAYKIYELSKSNDEADVAVGEYLHKAEQTLTNIAKNNVFNKPVFSKYVDKYIKEGYQGIIDPQDWYGFDFPVIVFETEKNLKLESNKQL